MRRTIPKGKPKFKNRKVEEIKYYWAKDNQLMEKFIRQLEGRVEGAMEGEDSTVLGVEKYDSLIKYCAEETPQNTFRRNVFGEIKTSEPIWIGQRD